MRLTEEAWDQNFEANLKTTFASTHAAIPSLTDGGNIINIASMAALQPARRLPAYGAAKAAVVHLTKTLSMELAPRRIRVNCICPGVTLYASLGDPHGANEKNSTGVRNPHQPGDLQRRRSRRNAPWLRTNSTGRGQPGRLLCIGQSENDHGTSGRR